MREGFFELLKTEAPAHLGPQRRGGTLPAAELLARCAALEEAVPVARTKSAPLRALLLLWHDHWAAAHELVQPVDTPDAALVHAMVHRREPDPWNSKYWWRRTGAHPALARLVVELETEGTLRTLPDWRQRLLPGGRWDPFAFVGLCTELQGRAESPETHLAREVQRLEFHAVLVTFLQADRSAASADAAVSP